MRISRQFIRFLLVGGLNTVFGYGVFALQIYLGVNIYLASIIGMVLGVIFNFFTTGRLVFRVNSNHAVFRFVFTYGVMLLLNLMLIHGWLAVLPADLPFRAYITQLLCMIILIPSTYFCFKRWVFH